MAVNISTSNWYDGCNLLNKVTIDGVDYNSDNPPTIKFAVGTKVTFTAKDGYSFNPDNPTPPNTATTQGVTAVWVKGMGTKQGTFSAYELSDDFTQITYTVDDSILTYLNYGINEYAKWSPIYYNNYCKATEAQTMVYHTITQDLTGVTTDITETEIEDGASLTGTFTLKEGYENLSYSVVMGSTTITGTDTSFTIDKVTDDVTISAYATKKVCTITYELNQCEITEGGIPSSVDYGESFFFAVKPATGYNKIVTAYYTDDEGNKTDIPINSSGYVSTVILVKTNIHIFINAVETYSITETLTNVVSASTNVKTVEQNKEFTLNYTPVTGYLISTLTCNIGAVTIASDKLSATIKGTATENITVEGAGEKIYTVSITGDIGNATCNYSNGDIIDTNKNIIITANKGYEFLSNYTFKCGAITYSFDKSDDNSTLTARIMKGFNYYLQDSYIATKKTEKIGSFCNLYNVTSDELTALSKKRFVDVSGNTVDYGGNIAGLYILPLTIPDSYKGDTSTIILGNYDSTVKSTLFNTYRVELEGGTITIPAKYNNVYDYLNTECILRLPFFDPINLDVDNVINQTITIKYTIDLYSGNCTVNIYSTFTDGIIESQTNSIATQIPFIQKQTNSVVNQLSNVFKYVIDTAYIEVVRNIPYFTSDIYGKETIDYNYINTVKGYCEVSKIELSTSATDIEIQAITELLKAGVIIS